MAVLDMNFLDWLEQQPERIALRESMEQLLQEYRRHDIEARQALFKSCLLYTSPSPRD